MTLADRLKMTRDFSGKTQKAMAKECSLSVQMWQAYEAGSSVPGGKVLESLSRKGFDVNWILTGEGEMRRSEGEMRGNDINGALKTSEIRETFADRFKKALTNTPEWLSERSGISVERINELASGAKPSADEIGIISDELLVDEFWLNGNDIFNYKIIDTRLISVIIEAEYLFYRDYLGKDDAMLSIHQRIEVIIKLYIIFVNRDMRPYAVIDTIKNYTIKLCNESMKNNIYTLKRDLERMTASKLEG